MKKEKKPGAEIAKKIIEEYQLETVTDMENALTYTKLFTLSKFFKCCFTGF